MRTLVLVSFTLFLQLEQMAHAAHDFYISICYVDYNVNNKSIEIAVKVFTDDFEKAIEELYVERLHLGTDKEDIKAELYIQAYLLENFKLRVNQQKVALQYLGKEVDWENTWLYIEVPNVPSIESLEFTNQLLVDAFEEQKNTVHLNIKEAKETFIFHKDKIKHEWVNDTNKK